MKDWGYDSLLAFNDENPGFDWDTFDEPSKGGGGKPQYRPTNDIPPWLEWLGSIKLIWRNAPSCLNCIWANGGATGTRIFTIDAPHGFANYWHMNTDLKVLQFMNHANIEPVLKFFGGIKMPIIIVPAKPFFDFFEKQRPIMA